MKPYGRRKHDELGYRDLGAPSAVYKATSKVRKSGRRLLHKQARNDAKKELSCLTQPRFWRAVEKA